MKHIQILEVLKRLSLKDVPLSMKVKLLFYMKRKKKRTKNMDRLVIGNRNEKVL